MAIYRFEEEKQKKNNNVDYQKISGIVCVIVSIFALFCLITHFVPFMKSFLLGLFGLFCYPLFITTMAIGFALIAHKKYVMPKKYGVLLVLSLVFVLCILQLILVKNDGLSFWQYVGKCYTQKTTAGGIFIGLLSAIVLYPLGRLGAYIGFISLSIIFIALSVDYIHYLSKNEDLKKSIKIANTQDSGEKISLKQLEQNLKQQSKEIIFAEEQKVKLTLDAKEEKETAEEIAKRKLGLLASSKEETIENFDYTKYQSQLNTPTQTQDNKSILTSNSNNMDTIQKNLLDLKNRAKNMSYPISNSSGVNTNNVINNTQTKTENTLPNKVIHDDNTQVKSNSNLVDNKSIMENTNKQMFQEQKPVFNLQDKSQTDEEDGKSAQISLLDDDYLIDKQKDITIQGEYKNKQTDDFNQIEPVFVEDKNAKYSTDLDVEDFTNNVLQSLKKDTKKSSFNEELFEYENTAKYSSPNTLFVEQQESPTPIIPKKTIKYVPPPIELLTTESMDLSLVSDDVVRKREELELALDTFGIPAKCIGVVVGPAVTRYELEMPAGVSVKKVMALQEDIAYALSSHGDIRIEAPIPGRRAVGIEVPNLQIATVGLKDIIASPEIQESKKALTVALGKDISNTVKTFNFVKIPHLLVAGTTGSGKSVCINAIILSLIYRFSPDDIKLILIDPKMVEFSMYNNLPHLIMPNVITNNEMALNALSWCVDEMERRYLLLKNAKVKSLEEYNESEEVLEGKAEKLPYIIFIIDELSDLLMTARKEAEEYIIRILQKARAAGIHMILATQRPSADIVTGRIKANLPARICFQLMTFADSRTVLDQSGAEKLLGRGDMLFLSNDTSEPKRIQGCFVTTKEIENIVRFVIENNTEYDYDIKTQQSITSPKKDEIISSIDGEKQSSDGYDALMPQILKAVIENGHASISMIQRKFLVGYPRAARIIDQMESAGFISPPDGSKTRSVYITMEEYEKRYGEEE